MTSPPNDPFAALGLHGLSDIATPVLAGLVTGDPVLLMGRHGSAKTALVRTLAGALDLRFRAYDASKAMFEDIIGFPDPRGLADGKVRYVPTELSIWGTELVLIDELSRANPATQNKWMEVVRARQVMGLQVDSLRFVFAAMNPPGYLGARPLDPALVGRFAFIIQVPGVERMTPSEVAAVIQTAGHSDAPACPDVFQAADAAPPDAGPIRTIVEAARAALPRTLATHGPSLVIYVQELAAHLRGRNRLLDGRRLALLYRGLAAALAVDAQRGHPVPTESRLFDTLRHGLPGPALEDALPEATLFDAHLHAWQAGFAHLTAASLTRNQQVSRVLSCADPVDMVHAYREAATAFTEEEHHELTSRVLRLLQPQERTASSPPTERVIAALASLLEQVCAPNQPAPLDVQSRVLAAWQAVSGVRSGTWEELVDLLARGPQGWPTPPQSPTDWLACRTALELSREQPGDPNEQVDTDRANALRAPLRAALTAPTEPSPCA